jgi:hypothetical protein
MSDDYAHHAGRTADPNFTPGTLAEQRAYAEGTADRYDRAIGSVRNVGGGSGTLMLPVFVVCAALFWPLVTALTLLPAYVAWGVFDGASANAPSLRPLLAAAVAGGGGLFIGLRIERMLQRSALYRGGRHVVRLIGMTIVATWVLLQYPGTPPIPADWTFAWVRLQLSPFQWVLIAAVVVGTHVLSQRMDFELRDGEDDHESDYDIEAEDSGDRWRRRGRSLVFCGVAGSLLVPLLGFESDDMFPAFAFAGVSGAVLSRWLYPSLVHSVWLLMPWVYVGARSRRSRGRRRRQSSAGAV